MGFVWKFCTEIGGIPQPARPLVVTVVGLLIGKFRPRRLCLAMEEGRGSRVELWGSIVPLCAPVSVKNANRYLKLSQGGVFPLPPPPPPIVLLPRLQTPLVRNPKPGRAYPVTPGIGQFGGHDRVIVERPFSVIIMPSSTSARAVACTVRAGGNCEVHERSRQRECACARAWLYVKRWPVYQVCSATRFPGTMGRNDEWRFFFFHSLLPGRCNFLIFAGFFPG